MDTAPLLTKTTLLRGVQCQKSLALAVFKPGMRTLPGVVDQFRMKQGQAVGAQAHERYPGGSAGRIPGSFDRSVDRTQELLHGGEPVVYEAAFKAAGVRVVADILAGGQNGWRLIEVKSTTRAKPDHVWDMAVQVYVLRSAGVEIEASVLLHLNTGYVRQGELDHQALFNEASLLEDVEALLPEVERVAALSRETLAAGLVPEIPIGRHCTDPNECDFKDFCWRDVPSPSVFDVYYIGKKAYGLYDEGIERIEDIPADYPLDKRSRFHIDAHSAGERIVEPEGVRSFLAGLHYPLHCLDFETFAVPIPPFDGLSPYAKAPFQYSLHIQDEPGGAIEHHGFLAEAGVDPRDGFLESMLEAIQESGSILVYNLAFERGILNSLREVFPSYQTKIDGLIERLVDLMDPFRQRAFWHPDMGGSNSLKAVLPVFAPDLSYEALDIGDGEMAMVEFLSLADETDPDRVEAVRRALWEYCHLDTLAMVRIVDGLRNVVEAGF